MLTTDELKDIMTNEGYTVLQCRMGDRKERIMNLEQVVKRKKKYCILISGDPNGGYITNSGNRDIPMLMRLSGMLVWSAGRMTLTPQTSAANVKSAVQNRLTAECNICMEKNGVKGCPQCTFRYCLTYKEKGLEQARKEGVFRCGIGRHALFTAVMAP